MIAFAIRCLNQPSLTLLPLLPHTFSIKRAKAAKFFCASLQRRRISCRLAREISVRPLSLHQWRKMLLPCLRMSRSARSRTTSFLGLRSPSGRPAFVRFRERQWPGLHSAPSSSGTSHTLGQVEVAGRLRHRYAPIVYQPHGLCLELTAELSSRHIQSPVPFTILSSCPRNRQPFMGHVLDGGGLGIKRLRRDRSPPLPKLFRRFRSSRPASLVEHLPDRVRIFRGQDAGAGSGLV